MRFEDTVAPVQNARRAGVVEMHDCREREAVQQPVAEPCSNRDKPNESKARAHCLATTLP